MLFDTMKDSEGKVRKQLNGFKRNDAQEPADGQDPSNKNDVQPPHADRNGMA